MRQSLADNTTVNQATYIDKVNQDINNTFDELEIENESDEWRALYESNRFFVLPSASENFPISLLEAGLGGMVILTTKLPGHLELLCDDAIYFRSTDELDISATLSEVISKKPEDWKSMTGRLRNRIINQHSWDRITEQYTKLYLNVLKKESTTNI